MKLRRPILFVLLSLLLVLSQQMGIGHALTHLAGSTGVPELQQDNGAGRDASRTPAALPDQSCAQCLAFAQVGAALATHVHSFPVARSAVAAIADLPAHQRCQRTVCAFHSRAPPILS